MSDKLLDTMKSLQKSMRLRLAFHETNAKQLSSLYWMVILAMKEHGFFTSAIFTSGNLQLSTMLVPGPCKFLQ